MDIYHNGKLLALGIDYAISSSGIGGVIFYFDLLYLDQVDAWVNNTTYKNTVNAHIPAGTVFNIYSSGAAPTLNGRPLIGTTTGLTAEEQRELDSLEKQREIDTKNLKLKKYKDLPKHVREKIYTNMLALDAVNDINSTQVEPSQREIDLQNRKMSIVGLSIDGSVYMENDMMIREISVDELGKAHSEACLEEEIER